MHVYSYTQRPNLGQEAKAHSLSSEIYAHPLAWLKPKDRIWDPKALMSLENLGQSLLSSPMGRWLPNSHLNLLIFYKPHQKSQWDPVQSQLSQIPQMDGVFYKELQRRHMSFPVLKYHHTQKTVVDKHHFTSKGYFHKFYLSLGTSQ